MIPLVLPTHAFHRFGLLDAGFERAIRFAKEAGFDGIELTETYTSRWWGPKRLRDMATSYDLPIMAVHQSNARMFWSTLPSIARLAERAHGMGAPVAVVHLGGIRQSFDNNVFFDAVKALEERWRVRIAFENAMAQFSFLRTSERAKAHEPDGFATVLDTHKLNATYDVGHMATLTHDLVGYVERIRERLRHLHLHDVWGRVDHLPLGTGELPLAALLRHLERTSFDGSITLEVFPYNTRPLMTRRRAEDLLRTSLAYARAQLGAT